MKLIGIFALFTLSTIVEGAIWAAAVQPVILTLGAIFTAIDQDVLDVQSIEWKRYLPFINKLDKQDKKEAQEEEDLLEYSLIPEKKTSDKDAEIEKTLE